jgi:hypothetical protein
MKKANLNIEETAIDAAIDMELDAQPPTSNETEESQIEETSNETEGTIKTVLVEFIANPIAFNFSNAIGDICEISEESFELLSENGIVKPA